MTEGSSGSARIPLQVSQGCVVASVQVDLRPDVLRALQQDMLDRIRDDRARAVIIDLSGLKTIDPEEFTALQRTMKMARLLGARPILSGLNAGVVSALVDLDVDVGDIEATRTLDSAFALVGSDPLPGRAHPTHIREIEDVEEPEDTDSE